MADKAALLTFDLCQPCKCEGGKCSAMLACKHRLIKQEKAGEMPMFSPTSCSGCGDCLRACPQKAIQIARL